MWTPASDNFTFTGKSGFTLKDVRTGLDEDANIDEVGIDDNIEEVGIDDNIEEVDKAIISSGLQIEVATLGVNRFGGKPDDTKVDDEPDG